jgi:membrane protease YdiL (CAAX protease family)
VLVVAFPVLDRKETRLMRALTSSARRINWYRKCIASLWLALAAAFLTSPVLSLVRVKLNTSESRWLLDHPLASGVAMTAAGALLLLSSLSGIQCLRNVAFRQRIAPTLASMQFVLPVSSIERRWWIVVSLSAGVCEEILFRGFLFNFLHGAQLADIHIGAFAAFLLTALSFGSSHLYQGWQGMVSSVLIGMALGVLAITTGSLLLPILLHILMNVKILWMYKPLEDNPDLASKLISGYPSDEVEAPRNDPALETSN